MDNYVDMLNLKNLDKSLYEYIIPIKEMYYIQYNNKTPMSSKQLLISIRNDNVIFAIEGTDQVGPHIYKAIITKSFLDSGLKYFPFYKQYIGRHQIDYSGVLIGSKIYGNYWENRNFSIDYEPSVLRKNSISEHNFCFDLDMISFIGFDDKGKFVSLAFDKDNFNNKDTMKFAILSSSNNIKLFRGIFISPLCLELMDVFNDNYSITINFSHDISSLRFVDNYISHTETYNSYYLERGD